MLIPTLHDSIILLDLPLRTVGAVRIVFIDELASSIHLDRALLLVRTTPFAAVNRLVSPPRSASPLVDCASS